jgi:hypothetical protein
VWKLRSGSPEGFQQVVDNHVEIAILGPEIFDLPNGMNHGRVVLAAEAPADLG